MSNRSDTCHGKKCPFWKRYEEYCPNYVTGKWVTNNGHEYTTKDCAPKRSMILSQQLYDFLVGTRQDFNSMRNANIKLLEQVLFTPVVSGVIDVPDEDVKQIEPEPEGS